jgi:cell wall-associated NlpC family hydrolase
MSANRRMAALTAIIVSIPFLLSAGIALAADASGALSPPAPALSIGCSNAASSSNGADGLGLGLSSSQVANAQIIYNVSVSLGLSQEAAIIAIATAMQESTLQDLSYGTSDSLGLFQQRPSQGWGTPAQIMQPVYAATAFYDGLVKVPGWQDLPLTVAAQDVQHSEYPGAYAQWQSLATALVSQFPGAAANCVTGNDRGVPASGTTQLPASFSLPLGTPSAVQTAIEYAVAQLGKPYIWGGTGPTGYDCSGLVMMAYQAAGINLPRTTFRQVDDGIPVYSLSQLEPGDLLFTAGSDGSDSDPGHVGMFIGDGIVIEAPETGESVMLTPLSGYWRDNTLAIRRIARSQG